MEIDKEAQNEVHQKLHDVAGDQKCVHGVALKDCTNCYAVQPSPAMHHVHMCTDTPGIAQCVCPCSYCKQNHKDVAPSTLKQV